MRRRALHLRPIAALAILLAATLLGACVGNSGNSGLGAASKPPVQNTTALTVDSGPAGAGGTINHAYVTITVCVPGSQTQCANVDHVLLDTGSSGLRLVRSVLTAHGVTLTPETDGSGRAIEECLSFNGGQTWGPVAPADVSIAGERASAVPVQVMDDTASGAPPPAACGANGTLINAVSGFGANGVLGAGVFTQDCGQRCVAAASPLPIYYGCTAAGACTAENATLAEQVTNVVALFAADNNGVIVDLPNLVNANGDLTVKGELTFGIATQSDNALPVTGLTVLGANTAGDFTATYNHGTAVLPALIDSGTDSYSFNDPTIPVCGAGSAGQFVGFYCPANAPQQASAVVTGVGMNNASATVDFAIADPNSFVAGAAAFIDLAGGAGSTQFILGMPHFYGRKIYIGIEQKQSGSYTGPYYAY